ncbi:T9SS type A sorting domain-containing protein [Aquimarina sp. MMG016]|uniref:T9SS type A sorting domain-containing protein n=1 Tax=Aquimarina sp. MMG016 TaxID=2822690 RepID=UPI001B39EB4D|nr:T9SS type A sorting domain-containing protein [Aquimarina sp. MMG016]MBQ4822830.1 T9SS type A sorting domain-containing protein [Aquimarina sp. MMG016]
MILSTPLQSFTDISFQIFSNPLLGKVYIDFNYYMPKAYYEVFNKNGDLIKKGKNLSIRNTISLDSFPTGMYTIKVQGETKSVAKSFLRF